MRVPGKLPPERTPNSSDLYGVVDCSLLKMTWSRLGALFHPKYMPPEPSARVKVISALSGDAVQSNGGPLVCGAPTPSAFTFKPSRMFSLARYGSSGFKIGLSVKSVSPPLGFQLS